MPGAVWPAEWLALHARAYVGNSAGQSPEHLVWRQAVRAEGAVASGGFTAATIIDSLKRFL